MSTEAAALAHLCSRELFESMAGPGGSGLKPPPVTVDPDELDDLDALLLEGRRQMWLGRAAELPS